MTGVAFTLDPPVDAERLEAGRLLFAREAQFVIGCAGLEQLPTDGRLEICFAGRSNVGKSSLLNAVTGRRALARTSNTPGRTQQLNYFDIDDKFYLVDLPGYGFAAAPVAVVESWRRLVRDYLRGRATLRRVYLLIDGRHGPKAADEEIMTLLDSAAVSFQAVLTKADKPGAQAFRVATEATMASLAKHPATFPEVLATSSETKQGVPELRAAIATLLQDG